MLTHITPFIVSPEISRVDIPTVQSKHKSNPNINQPIQFSPLLRLIVIPDSLKESSSTGI